MLTPEIFNLTQNSVKTTTVRESQLQKEVHIPGPTSSREVAGARIGLVLAMENHLRPGCNGLHSVILSLSLEKVSTARPRVTLS